MIFGIGKSKTNTSTTAPDSTASRPPLNESPSDPSTIYHDASSTPKERLASDTSDGTAVPQYAEKEHSTSAEAAAETSEKKPKEHALAPIDVKTARLTDTEAFVTSPVAATPISPKSAAEQRHERAATAESSLDAKTKLRLSSAELKDAKTMSKLIQKEQKESNVSLRAILNELVTMQIVHKKALRAENKATSKHADAVKAEYKTNMKFLAAQAKHERALAELKSRTESLAAIKKHAADQTILLEAKTKEVEELRAKKAVEDREREAKLQALAMNPTGV